MCNTLLSCPLCTVPRFHNLETLRVALIKVATENLSCPICEEFYMGLDKLTIHLFSHQDDNLKIKQNNGSIKTEDENLSSDRDTNPSPVSDANSNETTLSADVREYKKRRNRKKPRNQPKNMLEENSANENSTATQNLSIFNVNTIVPFIGIPQNISVDSSNSKLTKQSEKKEIKNNRLSEKCDICGYFFLGKNILEMHKKLIHNVHNSEVVNGVSHYCCHICSKIFKMKGSLMVHLRMVHFAIIPSVSEEIEDVKSDVDMPKEETKPNNQKSVPTADKSTDGSTIEPSAGKTWKCDICEKNFTTKYFLKKHKRLHTGEMPYSCSQCNKTFTFQQSYHKHLLYHNDEKPHVCSHCGRGFKELSTLHNHQRIHTGEKPFECETCGKCFRQRVSYLVHRRIHTGAMPYKCTACDKSFRYKVSQRMHKCTAQPPGVVIRQSGELVQKLLKNQQDSKTIDDAGLEHSSNDKKKIDRRKSSQTDDDSSNHDELLENICNSSFGDDCNLNFTDKSSSNQEKHCIIDEIVKESISRIDFSDPRPSTSIDFHNSVGNLYSILSQQTTSEGVNGMNESLPSPSDGMKNLKLHSLSPENSNMALMKDYERNDVSYMFDMTSDNNYIKDKDIDYNNIQNNMECHDIFPNR